MAALAVVGHAQEHGNVQRATLVLEEGQDIDCELIALEEGFVHFRADWLKEPGRALMEKLRRIEMMPMAREHGSERLILTNEDVLVGTIKKMSNEQITLESTILGEVQIPRAVVTEIIRLDSDTLLLESNFAYDGMGKWRPVEGNFEIRDEALLCRDAGAVSAQVEHKGSFTASYSVTSTHGRGWDNNALQVFRSRPRERTEDSLTISLDTYSITTYVVGRHGRMEEAFETRTPSAVRRAPKAKVHITYDAPKEMLTIWINGEQVGTGTVSVAEASGKYIALTMTDGLKLTDFRMVSGVEKPGEAKTSQARAEAEVLEMQNGDRLSTESISLNGRELTATLPHGELELSLKHVSRIIFRTVDQERPRRNAGDAHVVTARGRLTMVPSAITDQHLIGRSDYMGTIQVDRRALRGLELHIYRSSLDELRGEGISTQREPLSRADVVEDAADDLR
jgi:hypothetical protein